MCVCGYVSVAKASSVKKLHRNLFISSSFNYCTLAKGRCRPVSPGLLWPLPVWTSGPLRSFPLQRAPALGTSPPTSPHKHTTHHTHINTDTYTQTYWHIHTYVKPWSCWIIMWPDVNSPPVQWSPPDPQPCQCVSLSVPPWRAASSCAHNLEKEY